MTDSDRIVLLNSDNNLFRLGDIPLADATKEFLWGGNMHCHGERKASRFVYMNRRNLREFIYLPERHKGGRMVRPLYCEDYRRSYVLFPNVTLLGFYADLGIPTMINWVVPTLEALVVFVDDRHDRGLDVMQYWSVDNAEAGPVPADCQDLSQRTFRQCPHLKEINVCASPDFSCPPGSFKILRRLVPPQPMPANCLKVLFVTACKPQDENVCHMAKLPVGVLDHILSLCHVTNWKMYTPLLGQATF
jgi:hypothetical protein